MVFKDGDVIRIHYTVKRDGEVFETTREELAVKEGIFDAEHKYKPAVAVIGEHNFFEKVDNELKGMEVGQKKSITLEPKDAFGERKPELVRMVALKEFKRRNITPFPGLVVDLNGAKGRVQSVSGGRVRVDFNPPLAGKTIEFDIEVIEKMAGKEAKAKALAERYFPGAKEVKLSFGNDELTIEGKPESFGNSGGLKKAFTESAFRCLPVKRIKFIEIFEKTEKMAQKSTKNPTKMAKSSRRIAF